MDELILTLLKENGRIIIPDFGALLVKQKNPFTVIFNEFLQYNDGALIAAVETSMKINRDAATQKVKDLTIEYQDKLNKGEKIILNEIGILTKNSTGKISLISKEDNLKEQSKPISSTLPGKEEKVNTVEFDLEPEVKNDQKPVIKEPEKKPIERTFEKPVENPVAEKKIEPVTTNKPINTQPNTPIKKPETPISKPKETVADKKSDVNSSLKPPIQKYAYTPEPVRNKKSIFLWVFIIVVVNGAIIGYFLYGDKIKQYLASKKSPAKTETLVSKEATPEQPVIDSTITDEPALQNVEAVPQDVVESTPETAPETTPKTTQAFAGTKYFVVAGVFRDESNADKLVKELRDKGYNAEKFGKIGNMYSVSYDVFQSKQEADNFMLKIKDKIDNEAWIKVID